MTDHQSAINQRFASLDDYLAWLRQNEAPVDGAWYEEVSPGVYELRAGGNLKLDVPAGGQQRFTRAELERKFGFAK
ncbi:MAG: hypothetical protein ABIO29_08835 [Sphingomicrobium sp.]